MKNGLLSWGCACFLLLGAARTVAADEVRLWNGDRISGEVIAKSGERIIVRTPYAGEISIRWADVVALSTDRPVELMLQDGEQRELLRGRLLPREGGGLLLQPDAGEARALTLADVDFINPKLHETGAGTTYTGRVNLSASDTSGNVETQRLYGDGQFNARALEYGYGLSAKIERQTDTVVGTHTAWLLGGNYDRFLGPKQFAYVRGSLEHDRVKDIDRRSTVGVGYGVHVLDTPAAKLTVRAGVDHVEVDRLVAANERYPAFGWGIKASFSPWKGRVEFFHDQDGFLNMEDTDTVIVRSSTGVRVPLVARLSATAQVNVDWERTPAPGREQSDRTLLLGVDYTF